MIVLSLGDWSLSGELTNAELQARLDALQDLSAYEPAHSLSASHVLSFGDLNHDGQITIDDFYALEDLLT